MTARSILIVGAGAFGAAAAIELRRRGHHVRLIDPGPLPHPDASSTDISKAVRMDYGSDEHYVALAEESLAGWRAWNRQWGVELFHECGVIFLSQRPFADGGFESDSHRLLTARGHRLERIGGGELRRRFPAWSGAAYADGYFNAEGGWAESGRVVDRLVRQALAEGVRVHEGVRAARLVTTDDRVAGIETSNGNVVPADVVVVAAGAWTQSLLPHLGDRLWAVGQPVLHFRPSDPADFLPPRFAVWCADISRTGWYGFPARADGIVKVANHGPGTRVDPAAPRIVDSAVDERFREFLRASLPSLADAPVVARRLCLYEDSIDGDFLIDHDPDRPGLVVAAGGSGHGFKFAPALGSIVADVVERKPNRWAARFAWRAPGERRTEQARLDGPR